VELPEQNSVHYVIHPTRTVIRKVSYGFSRELVLVISVLSMVRCIRTVMEHEDYPNRLELKVDDS